MRPSRWSSCGSAARLLACSCAALAATAVALAASTGTATRWLEPTSGSFHDPRRWDNGAPSPSSLAEFGASPGALPFAVTFDADADIAELAVVSQSPALALDGHELDVAGWAVVAGPVAEAPALDIAGGTLRVGGLAVGSVGTAGALAISDGDFCCGPLTIGEGSGASGAVTIGPHVSQCGVDESATVALGWFGGVGALEIVGPSTSLALGAPALGIAGGTGTLAVRSGATLSITGAGFGAPTGGVRSALVVRDPGSVIDVNGSGIGAEKGPVTIDIGNGGKVTLSALDLADDSLLRVELGPGGSGSLGVFGALELDGAFDGVNAPGFAPGEGAIYSFASAVPLSGWFDAVSTPPVGGTPMALIGTGTALMLIDLTAASHVALAPTVATVPVGFAFPIAVTLVIQPGFEIPVSIGTAWTSDDPSVAVGSADNLVHGLAPGTTTLHAAIGGAMASMTVHVVEADPTPAILRASVSSDGAEGDADSSPGGTDSFPAISDDGRFVAFSSLASTLVAGDTNGVSDVFVHDCATGDTTRVSVSTAGAQGNGASLYPAISGDGRYVSFASDATTLANLTVAQQRVYVHDRMTGETRLVPTDQDDLPSVGPSYRSDLSCDGRFIVWVGANGDLLDPPPGSIFTAVFRKDLVTGEVTVVSKTSDGVPAKATNGFVGVDAGGDWVVFSTTASLVPGAPTSPAQAYLTSSESGEIYPASRSPSGAWANAECVTARIDDSGRRAGFLSAATNLVPGSVGPRDFFVADRVDETLRVANTTPEGAEANTTIGSISLSGNGRFATFRSSAPNLAPGLGGIQQIFRKDLLTEAIDLVSVGPIGVADGDCVHGSATSADGGHIAFGSLAANLVALDTNDAVDVFRGEATPGALGDVNGDGVVAADDLAIVLAAWGTTDFFSDLDGDGTVTAADLTILLGAWTEPR